MSEKNDRRVTPAEPVAERSQLAVRVQKTTLRRFKLTCVRAGMTMQDAIEEALTRWVQEREGDSK